MDYSKLSKNILENVGGIDNINFIEHCATRLRIHFNKKNEINEEAIKQLDDIAGVVTKPGQLQIIIGPQVHDVYNSFLDVTGWQPNTTKKETVEEEPVEKNIMYYLTKFGNFNASVLMPIMPVLITGGLILAIRNLLINYFGLAVDGGTANIMMAIFGVTFSLLPIWIGYSMATRLKLEPIMGGFLGAVLTSTAISDAKGLSMFGLSIPTVTYTSSVIPIVLGMILMYWVDKLLQKVLIKQLKYFLKPLLTMIIVLPVTLFILGPIGTTLGAIFADITMVMMDTIGGVATAILSVFYPYLVMFGIEKSFSPISVQFYADMGYDPIFMTIGYVSNLCIGATALAVATSMKDKGKRGMHASFAFTALCGVTEPAFYGTLITRPKVLLGTATGALAAGLFAGLVGLRSFVNGGCPGLLTFLFFVDQNGGLHYVIMAVITAVIGISVSFLATKFIILKTEGNILEEGVEGKTNLLKD